MREPSVGAVLSALQFLAALGLVACAYAAMFAANERKDKTLVDFDGTIINYLVYIQCALPLVILPCYTVQRKQMAAYLRDWNTFQVKSARLPPYLPD